MHVDNVWCQKHKRSSVKIVPLSWQQRGFIPKHKMWCGWRMDELWSMPSLSHHTVAHTKATPRKLMNKKGSGIFDSLSIRNPVFRWHRQQTRWHRHLHCLMSHSGFCNDNYVWLTFQCYQAVCWYILCVYFGLCEHLRWSSNQLIKYFDVGNLKINCPTISKHTHSTLNYPLRLPFENTSNPSLDKDLAMSEWCNIFPQALQSSPEQLRVTRITARLQH